MTKTIQERLDSALDKTLLTMVKDGTTVVTKDGEAVKIDASHQVLEVARKRLSDLKVTKEVGKNSAAAKLADYLTEKGEGDEKEKKDIFKMTGVPPFNESEAASG